jgi:hypothetical protein
LNWIISEKIFDWKKIQLTKLKKEILFFFLFNPKLTKEAIKEGKEESN